MAWLDQNAMIVETLRLQKLSEYMLMLTTMPPHGSALFAPVSAQTCVQSLVLDVAVLQFLRKLWPQPVASSLQIQKHTPLLPASRQWLQHIEGRCAYCIAVTDYGFVNQALFADRLTADEELQVSCLPVIRYLYLLAASNPG